MKKTSTQPMHLRDIMEKNSRVDKNLVRQYEKLAEELQRLGVEIKPKFGLSHPLGGGKLLLYNGR